MNILLSDNFPTKLGTIKTWVESSVNNLVSVEKDNLLTTFSHKIILQNFELPNEFYCNTQSPLKKVESLICWRYFIKKINNLDEQLIIFCKLINPQADTSYSGNSGENLEAIEIENSFYRLHIGTEDA